MRGTTRGACSGGRRLFEAQDSLDLGEFRIGVLERRGSLHEYLDPDPVTDRHLVRQPAKIELKLGDARLELIAAAPEIDRPIILGE